MHAEVLGLKTVEEINDTLPIEKVEQAAYKKIDVDIMGDLHYKGLSFDDLALETCCKAFKVPYDFFLRCDEALKKSIIERFFKTDDDLNFVISNDKIRYVTISEFFPIRDLLAQFTKTLKFNPIDKVQNLRNNDPYIFNFVTGENKSIARNKNDITHMGVSCVVDNTFNGNQVDIGPFLFRLVCTNGMIATESDLRAVCSKQGAKFLDGIDERLNAAMNKSRVLLNHFIETDKDKVKDPAFIIHSICKDGKVNSRLRSNLLSKVPALGNEPTVYEVINLVTSYANSLIDIDELRGLDRAAGDWIKELANRCPTCKHVL